MNVIACYFVATTAVLLLLVHPNNVVDSFVLPSRPSVTTSNRYKDRGASRNDHSTNRHYQLHERTREWPSPKEVREINLSLSDEETQQSLDYLATLIQTHLDNAIATIETATETAANENSIRDNPAIALAKHRFIDLTTSLKGELILENLFSLLPPPEDLRLVQQAIMALQSLLVYAMQIGVKGTEESQKKMVRHLFRRDDPTPPPPGKAAWITNWDSEDIRRLKFYRDGELGKRVLAALKRRRTAVGAYELLLEMGVWHKFEEVSLLRSGFPVRFWEEEEKCSLEVSLFVSSHSWTV